MCVMLIQGQESGGPGNQRGSSTGAAGPGHEPQPAHLPGPRRRAHPGERNRPFSKLSCVSVSFEGTTINFQNIVTLIVLKELVKTYI